MGVAVEEPRQSYQKIDLKSKKSRLAPTALNFNILGTAVEFIDSNPGWGADLKGRVLSGPLRDLLISAA